MARKQEKIEIDMLPTGVPNLDAVLGGGIPRYSINIVAGVPGSGKTILSQQIGFHTASPNSKVIYFNVMGEPTLKLIRYQQQFDFFDAKKLDKSLFFVDIGASLREKGLTQVLEDVRVEVDSKGPVLVILDSFRAITDLAHVIDPYSLRTFSYDLTTWLSTWGVTALLVGEYAEESLDSGPEFTVADGILWLSQESRANSIVRKLQVRKWRGAATQSGKHTFRIDRTGVHVYPRLSALAGGQVQRATGRLKMGIQGLDSMMRGGVPAGESLVIAGSSGTGKTTMALHFVAEGVRSGDPGVMVTFEERPEDHIRKASGFGWDLAGWEKEGFLRMIYLRPVDLSVDEVLAEIIKAVEEIKATRVVINSISGFELALAPTDKEDFREALYRLNSALTSQGITVVMTTEVPDIMGEIRFSPPGLSFIADNVILLRYAEIESELRKALMVVKMRTSDHDKELREYVITNRGIMVAEPFVRYSGVLSGMPTLSAILGPRPFTAGLSDQEEALMHVLLALHEAPVSQLASSMDLDERTTQEMLGKLVATGYVSKLTRDGQTFYRVSMVTPSLTPGRGRSRRGKSNERA